MKKEMPIESPEAIGARIKAVREQLGIAQKIFAGMIGVIPSSLSQYESGSQYCPPQPALRICAHSGVSMDFIYRGTLKDLPERFIGKIDEWGSREPPSRPPRKPRKRA